MPLFLLLTLILNLCALYLHFSTMDSISLCITFFFNHIHIFKIAMLPKLSNSDMLSGYLTHAHYFTQLHCMIRPTNNKLFLRSIINMPSTGNQKWHFYCLSFYMCVLYDAFTSSCSYCSSLTFIFTAF